MKRRILFCIVLIGVLYIPARAETIKWVDFGVPYESLRYAMEADISTAEKEKHISWIDILAVSACRTGGKCPLDSVECAYKDLLTDRDLEVVLGNLYQYFPYYKESFSAVLGGLLGHYAIEVNGQLQPTYGLKAFWQKTSGT